MMDSKSDHSAVAWMRKMHTMLLLITLVAQPLRAVVICPQCLPSLSLRHPGSVSLSKRRQYSRWVKKMARDGPRTMSHLATPARDKD